jgi:cyclase
MSNGHIPHGTEVPPPTIEEVAKGIYAYIQLDGSWFLNNAGCIVGERAATVVDATGTEARARAWRSAVTSITRNPVTALINTHHHADHTNGNFMFAPAASIIAHERCREEMVANPGFPRFTPLFPGTDFGDCPPAPPTVTFRDRLSVWVDGLEVQLISIGPAHTTNDIAAWIPERKVLFAGDVLFNGGTPFTLFGSIEGSLEALDTLEALGAETIIPGHGSVCGAGVIADVRAYLQLVQSAARRGFDAGQPASEVARTLDLGPFAALTDSERIVPNIHRAYLEFEGKPRGAPLPLAEMFQAMVDYNGGKPLRCLA